MDIKEAIRSGLKELILPEIDNIRTENKEIKITLEMTNKRLDTIDLHIIDQSRRIDETNKRIDETTASLIARIDKINESLIAKIDKINESLIAKIDKINASLIARIDKINESLIARIDKVNASLIARIDKINESLMTRIDETNHRLNSLYEVIVRREEHEKLELRIMKLEEEMTTIKDRIAA